MWAAFFSSLESARLPIRYRASLFSAGDEEKVVEVYKKMMAPRIYKRAQTVGDISQADAARAVQEANTTPEALGKVTDFPVGQTVEVAFLDPSPMPWAGVTARTAAWLRRESDSQFTAFAINCTHLGCPVRWLPNADLFMCPCHGGVFYADGRVASGPPPRPLTHYQVRVRDGVVEILASPLPITSV